VKPLRTMFRNGGQRWRAETVGKAAPQHKCVQLFGHSLVRQLARPPDELSQSRSDFDSMDLRACMSISREFIRDIPDPMNAIGHVPDNA
jgi:hypothetical protein